MKLMLQTTNVLCVLLYYNDVTWNCGDRDMCTVRFFHCLALCYKIKIKMF